VVLGGAVVAGLLVLFADLRDRPAAVETAIID